MFPVARDHGGVTVRGVRPFATLFTDASIMSKAMLSGHDAVLIGSWLRASVLRGFDYAASAHRGPVSRGGSS